MASQGGNPAGKRMSNMNLKAKRARSWARGQKKKEANRKAADAKMQANIALLVELGVTRVMRDRLLKSGRTVTKLESPAEALRRHYRQHPQS